MIIKYVGPDNVARFGSRKLPNGEILTVDNKTGSDLIKSDYFEPVDDVPTKNPVEDEPEEVLED